MVFLQAVLETILPITSRTANAHGVQGVDVRLTAWMRTLRGSQEGRLPRVSTVGGGRTRSSFPLCGRPFAGARAFVSCFGAVIEAVGAFAGFTAEGEEIKLVAIGVLTVGTDGFEVFVHGGKGLGFGRGRGSRRGRHDG